MNADVCCHLFLGLRWSATLIALALTICACASPIKQDRLRPEDVARSAEASIPIGDEVLRWSPPVAIDKVHAAWAAKYTLVKVPTGGAKDRFVVVISSVSLPTLHTFTAQEVEKWPVINVRIGDRTRAAKLTYHEKEYPRAGELDWCAIAIDPAHLDPNDTLRFEVNSQPFAIRAATLTFLRDVPAAP